MSVKQGQDRLLDIADYLDRTVFTPRQQLVSAEFSWLAIALRTIAAGGSIDIAQVLGVKAGRGQRTNASKQKLKRDRNSHMSGFIFTAMQPKDAGGLGLTLEAACALASESEVFTLAEDSIKTYWNNHPDVRKKLKATNGEYKLEE